jgi:hypothetical protein
MYEMKKNEYRNKRKKRKKRDRLWSLGGATTPASAMKKCTKHWN